jgi:D-alanyl-D-alanine carboxypeptidase
MKKIYIIPLLFLALTACGKKPQELKIEVNDKEIGINEEFYNTDGIDVLEHGEITTEKEQIDTTKLGEQEIKISVKDEFDEEKEYTYKINIVDKEAPVIKAPKEYEVTAGKTVDLKKEVSATDNSKEDIHVYIEGYYYYRTPGTYTLYYIATDSSGNEAKEEFTVTVKGNNQKKTTTSTTTTKKSTTTTTTPKKETKTTTNNNNNTQSNNTSGTSSSLNGTTTSKGYTITVKNGVTYINGYLIANKTYGLPSSYGPGGLTSETNAAAKKMFAAAKEDGYNMWAQSGYRSYNTQKSLYNNYVSQRGKSAADTFSARPGHSEHQTGLAFDVCATNKPCINSGFDSTAEAKWLANNAYKYGFILRYPSGKQGITGYKYESWHFRYVGVDLATKLYNGGNWITMEEYFGITSQYQ